MGQAGSDVAKDASDIVLTDDNFASIINAIEEGRRMFDNIQKFILHLLAENIAQACTLLIGLAFKDSRGLSVFPLAPVEIIWVRSHIPPRQTTPADSNSALGHHDHQWNARHGSWFRSRHSRNYEPASTVLEARRLHPRNYGRYAHLRLVGRNALPRRLLPHRLRLWRR